MTKLLHGNEKSSLTGGREPLFSQKELLILAVPLLVEQLLEVTVGMADTMMVSRCGEAAISGVSLVDMINNLIIVLFAALATGGAVRTSRSRSENSGFRPPNRGAFFSFVASIRFSSFWIWAQKSRFPPTLLPKGRKCTFYHACIHLSTARLPCKESFHRF